MQNRAEKVPNYPIGSVSNALRLLLMFREDPLIRVSEASSALGVAPSTAHRLLAMLEYHGFVQQDPATRGYRAGPAVIDIGLSAVRSIDVRSHLLPYMERLCDEVDETVQLMVLEWCTPKLWLSSWAETYRPRALLTQVSVPGRYARPDQPHEADGKAYWMLV